MTASNGDSVVKEAAEYPSEKVSQSDFWIYASSQLPAILNAETFVQFGNLNMDGFSSPYINGVNGMLSMVSLDGVPLFSPSLGYFDLKWFPLNLVKSVEVKTGGKAILWGPGAVGGALDLTTRKLDMKPDITELHGHWGNDQHRRLSGMFLKSFSEQLGFGVSASEIKEEDLSELDYEARNRNFGAVGMVAISDFDLRLFGSLYEGLDTDDSLLNADSMNVVRREDEHRIIDAKLSYESGLGVLSLRFNHQDYSREYFYEDETTFDSRRDNVDALTGRFTNKQLLGLDFEIVGDYHVYTIDTASGAIHYENLGGNISLSKNLNGAIFQAGLRADRFEDNDVTILPEGSIYWTANTKYSIFASGGLASALPVELSGGYGISQDKFYLTEGGFQYRQGSELTFFAKGFFITLGEDENQNPVDSEITSGLIEIGEIYGIQMRAEYTPDELFLLGARYNWNFSQHDVAGLPEYFVQAYAQEKRYYGNDEFSLTLRLEADGYFELPDNSADFVVFRARTSLEYLHFSIFGSYEYAVVDNDGWDNGPYMLTELMPGSQWRAGAMWELFD